MLKCTTREAYSTIFTPPSDRPGLVISDEEAKKYTGIKNLPENTYVSNSIFLHDEIEDMAGFDIPVWLEGDFLTDFTEGIHDIEVLLPEQIVDCKLYVWKDDTRKVVRMADGTLQDYVKYLGYIITPDSNSKSFVEKKYADKALYI